MIRDRGEDVSPNAAAGAGGVGPGRATSLTVHPEAQAAVERLWGSIFFSPERTAPKSILVTSAEPGEGATEVAVALALTGTSSQQSMRVALVDCNVYKPMLAELFGIRSSPGTLDVLAGEASLEDSVVPAANERLGLLPWGEPGEAATSLLRSERIAAMLRELAERYDHVIIDAPPVNRHAAVQALAGLTDGVVLVTKAGITRRESVAEAKKRIELAQGKIIGVVLNQREFPIPRFLYDRL